MLDVNNIDAGARVGFDYLLSLPLKKLENSNFITVFDLDNNMRLGLYYLMEIYNLAFITQTHGSWEWITLCKDNSDEPLKASQIKALERDEAKYEKFKKEYERGILPNSRENSPPKKEYQPFGWLSPAGEFIESPWGTHTTSAEIIIKSKYSEDEFLEWSEENYGALEGDYLCQVKGYCLIHNPSNDGGYIVTNTKQLTKKQKEFLYNYFLEIGNAARASMYIAD